MESFLQSWWYPSQKKHLFLFTPMDQKAKRWDERWQGSPFQDQPSDLEGWICNLPLPIFQFKKCFITFTMLLRSFLLRIRSEVVRCRNYFSGNQSKSKKGSDMWCWKWLSEPQWQVVSNGLSWYTLMIFHVVIAFCGILYSSSCKFICR